MNMASTPPVPTTGTVTCSWIASPCITMKPQVREGAYEAQVPSWFLLLGSLNTAGETPYLFWMNPSFLYGDLISRYLGKG